MVFNINIFVKLLICFCYCFLVSIQMVIKDTWHDSNINILIIFYDLIYVLSWRVSCVSLTRICILLLLVWTIEFISVRSMWYIVLVKSSVYLFNFSINILFIIESGILKSSTIFVLLSNSAFSSVNVCFIYSGIVMYSAYIFIIVMLSLWIENCIVI